MSGGGCGGSDNSDDGEDELNLPSNCTQADQFCSPDGVNGYICQNGGWSVGHCDEGTTCSRANDGALSCVPTNSTNNNTNNNNSNNNNENNNINNNETNNTNTNTNVDSGITWISIPAGSLTLSHNTYLYVKGSTIPMDAFDLGKTEVTVDQYEKCVKAGACYGTFAVYDARDEDNKYCNYNRGNSWKNHPMNCINWYGALDYCIWAGGRLPTEEEWEYAATHNGTKALQTKYPWGNSAPVHCQTANYYVDWNDTERPYCDGKNESSNDVGTAAVGTYSPAGDSPLGLVDMGGNVREWTAVVFQGMDFTAPMVKGGSISNYAEAMEVTDWQDPSYIHGWGTISDNGFRCAKDK